MGDVHSRKRASSSRNGPTGKRVRPQACASQRPGSVRCSALELFLLADGPDRASELSGQCNERFLRLNVSMPKRIESAVQSPLRCPGDLSHRRTDALRASDEFPAHVRRSPVGPSGFHEHPANSAVTRLGDSPTVSGLPARVFARRQPEEASELPGRRKAAQISDLGDNRCCSERLNALEGAQCVDPVRALDCCRYFLDVPVRGLR